MTNEKKQEMKENEPTELQCLEGLKNLNQLSEDGLEVLKELQEKTYERHVSKKQTFKVGLRAPVEVVMQINQRTGTYTLYVNGCQETSQDSIPNWDVKEFTCKNKACQSQMYYDEENKVLSCDRCEYTQEMVK